MFKIFLDMIITALYACVVQNLVFTASYGISESIRMAKRPKHFVMYGASVTFFCFAVSLVCSLICRIPAFAKASLTVNYIVFTLVLTGIYLLAAFICKKVLYANKKFLNSLSMCAFNTLVIALPGVNLKAGSDVLTAAALGIGAGAAFTISLFLVKNGMRHIQGNNHIPEFFKGTPAIFIYVSLIALMLGCISGESLFI